MNRPSENEIQRPPLRKVRTCAYWLAALAFALQSGLGSLGAQTPDGIVARVVSDQPRVRQRALAEIRRMTPRRRRTLTAPLVRQFADSTVRGEAAAEALSVIGRGATDALLAALDDANPSVRMYAANALGGISPATPEVVRALTRRVRDPNRAVHLRAVEALGRIGPAAAPSVPVLLDALERRGDWPTTTLIQTLGSIGPAAVSAVPTLIEVLEGDPYSVVVVARALGQLGDGAQLAVPQLLAALARAVANRPGQAVSPHQRDVIVESLARVGRRALAPLRAALMDLNPAVREASAEAIGRMGRQALDARPDLENRLDDPTPLVRAAAAEALGSMGSGALGSAPALEALLADPNAFVRARAAGALIALGDRASREAVERYRAHETSIAESDGLNSELWSLESVRAPRPATSRYRHPSELAHEATILVEGNVSLRVVVHSGPERPDLLAVWRTEGDSLRHLLSWEAEAGGRFDAPHSFTYKQALLLHLQVRHPGSSNLREDVIYHISPEGALFRVRLSAPGERYLAALSPGERIWKGPGYDFRDNAMAFSFSIWREGDADCCPSGGEVEGVFDLRGVAGPGPTAGSYRSTYRITPVSFTRLPSGSR